MNHKEMIESKTIVIEVKIAFDGLISGSDSAKEKIIEIEIKSIEDSHTGKQRQKKKINQNVEELSVNFKTYIQNWNTKAGGRWTPPLQGKTTGDSFSIDQNSKTRIACS